MRTTAKHRKAASGNPFLPLVLDVAIPLGSYYLLRHFGISLVMSLAIASLLPAVRVAWSIVRERTADGLALAVLALTVTNIPIAFITGSPKLLLAKESVGTGPLGIWLIVSVLIARPAMAGAIRAFVARTEGSALAWEQLSSDSARFRSCLNAATMVWGIGFIVECVARLVVIAVLPVTTAVWAVNIPAAVLITCCIVVQGPWVKRLVIMVHQRVSANDEGTTISVPLAVAA